MKAEDQLDRAEKYLEEEREILLSGRIAELAGLAERREAVLATLSATKGDGARLQRLRDRAKRNGALMSAAAEGVNRAIKRLAELRKAAGPIGSYSATGGRCEIGTVGPKFEKKA